MVELCQGTLEITLLKLAAGGLHFDSNCLHRVILALEVLGGECWKRSECSGRTVLQSPEFSAIVLRGQVGPCFLVLWFFSRAKVIAELVPSTARAMPTDRLHTRTPDTSPMVS